MNLFKDSVEDFLNYNSQHGEDKIIAGIFDIIGEGEKRCMEFGAADGAFCSNTYPLWYMFGWSAILIESDEKLFKQLEDRVQGNDRVQAINAEVNTVDDFVDYELDLLSIDVDGEDFDIWDATTIRHRVVVVEHNPTFPLHVWYHGGRWQGCSARSLHHLATSKGYRLVAGTKTNLIFVREEEASFMDEFDDTLEANFDDSQLNYVVTDYHGNFDVVGELPYGMIHREKMGLHV